MKRKPQPKMLHQRIDDLPDLSNFLSKNCFRTEIRDTSNECCKTIENNVYDVDEVEFNEVFADHMLMDKRLCKSLYVGNFNCLDDPTECPPISLTDLTRQIFSKAVPNYGLEILDMDYVSSVSEAAKVSPCAMIIAMIYLERLQLTNSDYLEIVSPPGLFVVTLMVASKFLFEDDKDIVTNKIWSEALQFDVKDLNKLESDFLAAIDWKVYVDSAEFFQQLMNVEKRIALEQSSSRQWLSYHEILTLINNPGFHEFCKHLLGCFLKTFLWCSVGYLATAVTLNKVETSVLAKFKHHETSIQNSTQRISALYQRDLVTNEPSVLPWVTKNTEQNQEFDLKHTTASIENGANSMRILVNIRHNHPSLLKERSWHKKPYLYLPCNVSFWTAPHKRSILVS